MTTLGASNIMNSDSIQKNWDVFKQLVQKAVTQFVPTTTFKPKNSPPWWTKSLSRTINVKHNAFSKYRRLKTARIMLPKRLKE